MEPIVWTSDLHLNTLDEDEINVLFDSLKHAPGSSIIISGDISDGKGFISHLKHLEDYTKKTIYFILGNHDFWGHSLSTIRSMAKKLTSESNNIFYLSTSSCIPLSEDVCILGHDGWADTRSGNFKKSSISLRDWTEIEDFKGMTKDELESKLIELADDALEELQPLIAQAFERYSKIILVTHAPPFKEVCLYDQKPADDEWACHFVWKLLGDRLIDKFTQHNNKKLLVLSGHTHTDAASMILPNVCARVLGRDDSFPQWISIAHTSFSL